MSSLSPGTYVPAAPTYAYIDGAYIRKQVGPAKSGDYRFNPNDVAEHVVSKIGVTTWGRPSLTRTFYYDVFPEGEDGKGFLVALKNLNDLTVREGHFAGTKRPRQKGVDVYLAVDALTAAQRSLFNVAILVAGDGDFVPLVNALTEIGPLVVLASFPDSTSVPLIAAVDRWIQLDPLSEKWQGSWSESL